MISISKIREFLRKDFVKNVSIVMGGRAFARALPILVSPVLTRLYTPEEFGMVALFMSVLNIGMMLSTGKYERAIMLPKRREHAASIVNLSLVICLTVSLLFVVILAFLNEPVAKLLGNEKIAFWLYFIPLAVLLRGSFLIFTEWSNRNKKFKNVSKSFIVQSTVSSSSRLGMGFAGMGGSGLILGNLFGFGSASILLSYFTYKKDKSLFRSSFTKKRMFLLARRYKKFPKFTLPSIIMNRFSLEIPVFLISNIYNSTILGFYSLANRMLLTPMDVLGRSVSEVYYQKASTVLNSPNELKRITYDLYKKLLLLGIIPFSIIGAFGDLIFEFVFGNEWYEAGQYAQVLSIWVLFNFISSPLSRIFSLLEIQEKGLIVNLILLIFRVAPFLIGALIWADQPLSVIAAFSFISSIFWIGFCFYLLKTVGVNLFSVFLYTMKILILFLGPLILIRLFL